MKHKNTRIIVFALTAVILLMPLSVYAKDGTPNSDSPTTSDHTIPTAAPPSEPSKSTETETHSSRLNTSKSDSADVTAVKHERLGTDKLKICEMKQMQVNETMGRVVARSKSAYERITSAAERAEAFYTKQDNVLSTYDTLLAKVTSTKAAALTAVNALSTKSSFSCDSSAPKADIQDFKTDRKNKVTALGAYRDAVKALIAGIKSVQPQTTEAKQ